MFIIILSAICSTLLSQTHFRNTHWGMSREEVKNSEDLELVREQEDVLMYQTNLSGFKAFIGYIFTNNKLTRAKYLITETHSNENDHISDYNDLNDLLEKKYGEPIEKDKHWKDDLYKDDYSDWGFAVSLGHLAYFTKWETESSYIVHALSGENYEISHQIEYGGKEYMDYEQKIKEEKTMDEL